VLVAATELFPGHEPVVVSPASQNSTLQPQQRLPGYLSPALYGPFWKGHRDRPLETVKNVGGRYRSTLTGPGDEEPLFPVTLAGGGADDFVEGGGDRDGEGGRTSGAGPAAFLFEDDP
jgi:hypothetical protein